MLPSRFGSDQMEPPILSPYWRIYFNRRVLSEKEYKQLGAKEDYLRIINISWFPNKNSRKSSVEILLE